MSNLSEMPAPSEPNNNPEQTAEERKKRAQELFTKIKGNAAPQYSRSSLQIGCWALTLIKENLFGILGFADEEEARDASGVGRSTWYSTIALARAFDGLPEELFVGMKLVNAQAALNLPLSKRLDRDWVKNATELTEKQFAKLVDEELHGKGRRSDGKERSVKMSIDMPASRKLVIEEKTKEFAEAHGMEATDMGRVIEVAMVEATGGNTMTGAILKVVARARRIKELCESGLSSDEVLSQVIILNEETILECAAVLEVNSGSTEAGSEEAA